MITPGQSFSAAPAASVSSVASGSASRSGPHPHDTTSKRQDLACTARIRTRRASDQPDSIRSYVQPALHTVPGQVILHGARRDALRSTDDPLELSHIVRQFGYRVGVNLRHRDGDDAMTHLAELLDDGPSRSRRAALRRCELQSGTVACGGAAGSRARPAAADGGNRLRSGCGGRGCGSRGDRRAARSRGC